MIELAFRPLASVDLTEIYRFSADRFGLAAADEYLAGLQDACQRLVRFPEMGAPYSNIDPPIRCLLYRKHRIFYDLKDGGVVIVRILHHAQDAAAHLN